MHRPFVRIATLFLTILSFPAAFSHAQSRAPLPDQSSLASPVIRADWERRFHRFPRNAEGESESNSTEAAEALAPNASVPNAAWSQSSGPETGNPFTFVRVGQRLYIGTFGGLWFSDDNGENWTRAPNLLAGRGVSALAANGTAIFVGANFGGTGGGLYRSTDNGQTWTAINNGFPAPRSIVELVANGANLYAATFNGELYGSTNNGDSWARLLNGLPNQVSLGLGGSFAINNNALFLLHFAANAPELYRSTNNGANWTKLDLQLPQDVRLVRVEADNSRVIVGLSRGGLRVSEDGGQSWRALTGLPETTGRSVPFLAGGALIYAAVFATTDAAAATWYASTDNGATWTEKSRDQTSTGYELLAEGQTIFEGTPLGIVRSLDGGATYEIKNRGLRSAATFSDIVQLGNRLFLSSHGGGLWLTTDNGATWRQLKNGFPRFAYVSALTTVGNTLYACLEQPLGFYRSTDFGENWTKVGRGLPEENFAEFPERLTANGGKLYLGSGISGAYVSEDNGENFRPLRNGIPATADVTSLAFKDATITVTTRGSGVFRSTDGGATFTAANAGLSTQFSYAQLYRGNNLFLAASNGVYRSADNGATWTTVLANGSAYFAITQTGSALYVAGTAGCFFSKDNGATWQSNNTGLFGRLIQLATKGNQVIVATEGNGSFFLNEDAVATVSAASFSSNAVADKAIVAAFGEGLATSTALASSLPLPTTLAGTSVQVRDSEGNERPAPLFFVSPNQINFQIPAGTANGLASVTVASGSGATLPGTVDIRAAAPAIFTLNASGTGAAAAVDALTGAAGPFNATQANGQPNIIAVFGTGLGGDATDVDGNVNANVTARLDGNPVTLLYAGRAPGFTGLNQFNVVLPAGITAGARTLTFARGGVTSNNVTLTIR